MRNRAGVGKGDDASSLVGHALVGAAQGSLKGYRARAFASGVTGDFDSVGKADGNASSVPAPSGDATALVGGSGGSQGGGVPSVFGLDSIEKTIEHLNPATFEMAFKLFA